MINQLNKFPLKLLKMLKVLTYTFLHFILFFGFEVYLNFHIITTDTFSESPIDGHHKK